MIEAGHRRVSITIPDKPDNHNRRPEGRRLLVLGWRTSSELIATSNKALS
jgi:hypothetical protein